jgi:hypothetical protein
MQQINPPPPAAFNIPLRSGARPATQNTYKSCNATWITVAVASRITLLLFKLQCNLDYTTSVGSTRQAAAISRQARSRLPLLHTHQN